MTMHGVSIRNCVDCGAEELCILGRCIGCRPHIHEPVCTCPKEHVRHVGVLCTVRTMGAVDCEVHGHG